MKILINRKMSHVHNLEDVYFGVFFGGGVFVHYGYTPSIWKFLGQGSNLCLCSN